MSAKRTIPVRILGQEYRVRSDMEEDAVRRAASLVDETMRRIQGRTGAVDTLHVAVLAALQLAHQVAGVGAREAWSEPGPSPDGSRVRALAELIESMLAPSAA
jgi:cell division protein ZapA (FtsZ GTPase activity inhibitor)